MGLVDEVTQRNASAAEELSSTSEELAAQAASLRDTVAFFRVAEALVPVAAPAPVPAPAPVAAAKARALPALAGGEGSGPQPGRPLNGHAGGAATPRGTGAGGFQRF
jgi:methyl-accepting chemotaxis protein